MAQENSTTKQLEGEVHFIRKANKNDTQKVITQDLLTTEDEFQSLYFTPRKNTNVVIEPPYNPLQLASLVHRNNILAQCIATMEVNIDGSGYTFELLDKEKDKVTGDTITDSGDKDNKGMSQDDSPGGLPASQRPQDYSTPPIQKADKDGDTTSISDDTNQVVDKELEMLEHFFNEPYPGMSFTTLRRKVRVDMEATGNGYIEVIRNLAGEVVFLRHLESVLMRLVKLDAPTDVEVTVTRGDKDFKAVLPMRERRYAYKVGAHIVYYREFGASRQVNKKTGAWMEKGSDDEKNIAILGSEVLHFTVTKDFRTHYGLPRWLNQLPSVLGSRKAEEYNLEFFDAGGLPPAIIFIQGGALVGGVKEQLNHYLSGKASQKHRAAIVEVMSTSGSLDSAGSVSVKTERFGPSATDSMFSSYDTACGEHIRKAFRIPPILLGTSSDYNRACYSDDTETLTDHGWINWDQYEPEMKIATVNPQTMALEYHYPFGKRALVYDVTNLDMYHIKQDRIDILVTPEHRMLFAIDNKYYQSGRGNWQIQAIEDMVKHKRIRLRNHIKSFTQLKELEFFEVPKVKTGTYDESSLGGQSISGDTFLEFLGYWVSEGSASDAYSQRGVVTVSQKKAVGVELISKCFTKLNSEGLKTYIYNPTEDGTRMNWSVKNFGLKEWLLKYSGHKCFNKRLPPLFRELPQRQLRILFDALMLGDGHISIKENHKCGVYHTTSKLLADDVQELAIRLGMRANLTKTVTFGKRPNYRVNVTWNEIDNMVHVENNISKVNYSGKVYCFSVPNGIFITRRNGMVAIQGNTSESAVQTAENQVFQPERFLFDEIINTTIIKALGAKRYRFRSLSMNISDPQIQLNTLTAAGALIKGEDFVEVANELSGLKMKYSAEAEAANKQQGQPDMGGGMDGGMGDPQEYQDGQTNPPPGQSDPNELSQPPQGNQFRGFSPQQQYGDTNSAAELGQSPPINYSGRY